MSAELYKIFPVYKDEMTGLGGIIDRKIKRVYPITRNGKFFLTARKPLERK